MLYGTCSAEGDLISAVNSTLFSPLSCLLFSSLSGNSFPLEHTSTASLWYSHTFCPCFHWGHPPSLESSLFPLKLSSIISPDKLPITVSLPLPLTSVLLYRDPCFHWEDPSHAEIRELFSVFRAPDFSDWYFLCCCYKAWTLSPGDGSLIFKLYEVKWCSNMCTGLMFRFNLYLFKFPVVCYVNWKKPQTINHSQYIDGYTTKIA